MNNPIRIIIDSTVDLPRRLQGEFLTVPLTVCFGTEALQDGVAISRERFYERLVESDQLPTTSQASPAAFQTVFDQVRKEGGSAVVLTISSRLSGTYQSACLAAADYENFFVVDTQTAAIGSGILAEYALLQAGSFSSAEALAAHLEEKRQDICLLGLLDTLEYLKRGGRISKTAAMAGGLLNIKPVVTIQNGEVALVGKARGSRQGNNLLAEKIRQSGGIDFTLPILLGYTGLSDAVLDKYVQDSRSLWQDYGKEPERTLLCSVIGTHVGPGAVAAAFFKKKG